MLRAYIAAMTVLAVLFSVVCAVSASLGVFSSDKKNYSAVMEKDDNGVETGNIIMYGRLEKDQDFQDTLVVKYSPDLSESGVVDGTVCNLLANQALSVADGQFVRCIVPPYDIYAQQPNKPGSPPQQQNAPGKPQAAPAQQGSGQGKPQQDHAQAQPQAGSQQHPGKVPAQGSQTVGEPPVDYLKGLDPEALYYYQLCTSNNECSPGVPLFIMIMRGEADADGDFVPDTLNGIKLDNCPNKNNFDQNKNACRMIRLPWLKGSDESNEPPENAAVDSDDDGVPDGPDLCPGTSPGVYIDENGCGRDQTPSTTVGVAPQSEESDSYGDETAQPPTAAGCNLIE